MFVTSRVVVWVSSLYFLFYFVVISLCILSWFTLPVPVLHPPVIVWLLGCFCCPLSVSTSLRPQCFWYFINVFKLNLPASGAGTSLCSQCVLQMYCFSVFQVKLFVTNILLTFHLSLSTSLLNKFPLMAVFFCGMKQSTGLWVPWPSSALQLLPMCC